MTPKISVIIPIYNDEAYLSDALQSVRNQTFSEFECICVNDGSDDGTEKIIDQFTASDNRYIKINQPNGGVSSARNTGFKVAKGEFIFFMDHDDLLPPQALQKLHGAIVSFNADMARGRMTMIADNFTVRDLPQLVKPVAARFFEDPIADFYRHARGANKTWCYIWQCLFRRSCIQHIRFVETLRAGREDNLYMYEVIGSIKNYVQLDCVVACHRRSKTSAMLGGYRPAHIKMFDTAISYVYQKYAASPGLDKRLVWWVYHKESYGVYRFLVRNSIRSGQESLMLLAREVLERYQNTPAFNEIWKRWGLRQKFFFWLFMGSRYRLLRLSRILM